MYSDPQVPKLYSRLNSALLCPGIVSHPNTKISAYMRGKQAFDPFSTRTSEGRLSARFMGVQMINNPI
ncbi:hypothetical protein GLS_c23430 [Gluconobacter oxydans DSM 3504]|uniref:Uncharacterized protein n=1 Tax=Gluconobacter oxydans DSM 3504 TaxID=1288313 RepID=A0A067Z6L8_GLUOY|nr:hypothetical protein GLS_c23430 [Gluconobacter oxydans DSM 3504]